MSSEGVLSVLVKATLARSRAKLNYANSRNNIFHTTVSSEGVLSILVRAAVDRRRAKLN